MAEEALKSRDYVRAENLAILLLDMAIQVSAQRDSRSPAFRLASAHVVDGLVAAGRRDPQVRAWFLLLDAFLEGAWNFFDLEPRLDTARRLFPQDSLIQAVAGSFYETRARAPSRFVFRKSPAGQTSEYGSKERRRDFESARDLYAQALSQRPQDEEVRLRLGRVAFELGHFGESLTYLRPLHSAQVSEETSYLAHLFAAASYEALGRLDESKAEYLEAMAWQSQAPSVGLSALLWASGESRNSSRIMDRLMANPPPDEIWQHYLKGQWRFLGRRLSEARSLVR